MKKGNGERGKTQWETLKDFEKDGLIVRVQKLGWRYSAMLGVRSDKDPDRVVPFIPLRVRGTKSLTDAIRLERVWSKDALELLSEAEEYAVSEEGYRRSRKIDDMVERDERAAARGKPRTRHTGKTERRRQKRKERLSQ
jgi:hypothetical protein